MAKRAPDEYCRQNYNQLRNLFDTAIDDHKRFEMVYAYGMSVGMVSAVVISISTSSYTSYAVGFDTKANEIVILPFNSDLSGHGEPVYLKKSEIKKVKQSFMTKEITIYDNRLPKKYVQFSVPDYLNQDEDDVIMLVKQEEEYQKFMDFFKKKYNK